MAWGDLGWAQPSARVQVAATVWPVAPLGCHLCLSPSAVLEEEDQGMPQLQGAGILLTVSPV